LFFALFYAKLIKSSVHLLNHPREAQVIITAKTKDYILVSNRKECNIPDVPEWNISSIKINVMYFTVLEEVNNLPRRMGIKRKA